MATDLENTARLLVAQKLQTLAQCRIIGRTSA